MEKMITMVPIIKGTMFYMHTPHNIRTNSTFTGRLTKTVTGYLWIADLWSWLWTITNCLERVATHMIGHLIQFTIIILYKTQKWGT